MGYDLFSASKTNPLPRRPTWAIYAFSALFILVGVTAVTLFLFSVLNDPAIRASLDAASASSEPQHSVILLFFYRFGIILPALVLGLSILLIALGVRLRTGHIGAGRWAQTVLRWFLAGLAVSVILSGIQIVRAAFPNMPTIAEFLPLIVSLILFALTATAAYWLDRNIERVFQGQDLLLARETRLAWNLLIPTFIVLIFVAARPLEQTLIRSLTDKQFAGSSVPNFIGLQNYANLLGLRIDSVSCRVDETTEGCATRTDGSIRWESIDRILLEEGYRTAWTIPLPALDGSQRALAISGLDKDFLEGLGTTLLFTVVAVSLELLVALFIAVTVNSSFKGRGLMRAVMLVPWAIPTVISARLWELMLKDTSAGIVNRVALDFNLISSPQAWLSNPTLQIPVAILVDVWKTAPFMALLLLAGLQTIPRDLYEAASVDGADKIRQFFRVTLPLLRPTIAVALVFRTLDSLRVFDLFNVLFGRQRFTVATYTYETLVSNQRDGYASALSMIIFTVIALFAFAYVRLIRLETPS